MSNQRTERSIKDAQEGDRKRGRFRYADGNWGWIIVGLVAVAVMAAVFVYSFTADRGRTTMSPSAQTPPRSMPSQ